MINALNDDLRTEKFTHTCVTFAVSEKTVFFHYFVDFVLLLRGGEIILINIVLIGVLLYQRIEYFMHIHLITYSFILNYFSVAL